MQSGKTVVCLGGAGRMGKTLARHLSQLDRIGTLIIADLDGGATQRVAAELGAEARCQLFGEQVGALSPGSLDDLLAQTDFLANTAGPFFR